MGDGVSLSATVLVPERRWRFPAASAPDVGRDAGGHLAFGHGIRYCLGAPLARFPSLSLAVPESSLRWRPSSLIHGLETLPVRLA